jgi:endonuclease YncB( thermonuclease family)
MFFNRACCLLSLHLLLAAHPAAAAALEGRVVTVSDGHSLVVLVDNRRIPVRVAGIDAPTGTERHAIAARQSLIAVCGGEPARVEVREQRRDGAVVARVLCNGADAAAEQVGRGMAKVGVDADAHLRALQAEARATKRGVWSTREAQVQRVDR